MIIAKAVYDDLDGIMEIIAGAVKAIGALGINQWQDGYPDRAAFTSDIKRDSLYVVKDEESKEVLGVYALTAYEPTYDYIEGKWLTDGSYVAVHRVAVATGSKRSGVASFIFDKLKEEYPVLRIDTHEGNVPMNSCLLKNGFVRCGIIYLLSGDSRVAYEWRLS